jgi:UDP:flavonoid glycosyltransferase YjiC (YdhE family)
VPARFGAELSRAAARRELALADRFTVLVTAGGFGLGSHVVVAADRLASYVPGVQLILNAGHNDALFREFAALAAGRDALVLGHTDRFEVLLAACDVVVGKAGFMTLTEAMAAGRPWSSRPSLARNHPTWTTCNGTGPVSGSIPAVSRPSSGRLWRTPTDCGGCSRSTTRRRS